MLPLRISFCYVLSFTKLKIRYGVFNIAPTPLLLINEAYRHRRPPRQRLLERSKRQQLRQSCFHRRLRRSLEPPRPGYNQEFTKDHRSEKETPENCRTIIG